MTIKFEYYSDFETYLLASPNHWMFKDDTNIIVDDMVKSKNEWNYDTFSKGTSGPMVNTETTGLQIYSRH